MLSSVLASQRAVAVNILIMRTIVKVRRLAVKNALIHWVPETVTTYADDPKEVTVQERERECAVEARTQFEIAVVGLQNVMTTMGQRRGAPTIRFDATLYTIDRRIILRLLRISLESDQPFRSNPITRFGAIRSAVSEFS